VLSIEPLKVGMFAANQHIEVNLLVKRALIRIGTATYEVDFLIVPGATVDVLLGNNDMVTLDITLCPAKQRARFGLKRAAILHRGMPQRPFWADASWEPSQPVKLYWRGQKMRLLVKDHGF
jgi:hypothetical protein